MENYLHSSCQINGLHDIYEKYFGDTKDGFFVDVGAYDGITYSNTYTLAMNGWSGIAIEPVKKYYDMCRKVYEGLDVNVIQLAANQYMEILTIYTGEHAVSTASNDFKYRITNTFYGKNLYTSIEKVLSAPLNIILEMNQVKAIDVLSIDVEGFEMEVLKGFSMGEWKPKMVIIEAHELHTGKDRPVLHPEINKYFNFFNYSKIYCDEINNIYVRELV
jgi:FkbM family methyltransferase